MVNDLSLNKTNASAPRICAKEALVPFALGGVAGKKKLSKPKTADAIAAILKVNTS
jgi:hypothetical protein